MAYKELIHKYEYSTDELGRVTGRRHFIEDSDGAILSLPVRGTSLMPDKEGTDITGCVCRQIKVVYNSNDKDPQYVALYSSQASGANGALGITNDEDSRTFDISAELLSLDGAGGGWKWEAQNEAIQEGVGLHKRIVLQNFTLAHTGLTTAEKNTLLGVIRDQAGTVNSAAFEGFAAGQVFFEGARGGDYINESGSRRWNLELSFVARLLEDEDAYTGTISGDDWQYLMNPLTAAFDKPKLGSRYLYRETNFANLVP